MGCASAETNQQGVVVVDSGVGGQADGSVIQPHPDAPTSSGTDASTGCTVMTSDLLLNSNFDGTPAGTGWTETTAQPPLVTAQTGGIAAQSPTYRAWLGGVATANSVDTLIQDVMVPASTTMLVLTGFYEVRTGETGTTVYDRGTVDITTTGGTQIELIKALDNAHATTAWSSLDKTLSNVAMMKGQTVRLHLTTTNDGLNATSFFFDTLHLNATYCQ